MNGLISSLITFVGMIGITAVPAEPSAATAPETSCVEEEVLWLARVTFSETKIVDEMPYIAWVVRNRVDTKYMGSTYKQVALYPNQFSGLNSDDEQFHTNMSLTLESENNSWRNAVTVAERVCNAPRTERLLPTSVRHFYSPRSVTYTPTWATQESLYYTIESSNGYADRFAFHNNIR